MNIQPADIVGIPFPFTDMSTQKKRPVLVLTIPDQRGDFTGLAVTSVLTEENTVCINPSSMKIGELPKVSWVRYDKIFTLSTSLIERKYGTLKKSAMKKIIDELCSYIGCL